MREIIMPLRTFIALDLDEYILDGLCKAQGELADPADKVKWVRAGEPARHAQVPGRRGRGPDQRCSACWFARPPPRCPLLTTTFAACPVRRPTARCGWSGQHRRPLRPDGRTAPTTRRGAGDLGFREEDRQFRPHITVARIKKVQNAAVFRAAVRTYDDFEFGVAHGDEVVAYASSLTDEGPIYTPLCHWQIG